MGRILILGGTEECIELAKRWSGAEILVSDPSQYVILKNELEGIKVHFGDWSNPETLSKLDFSNVDNVFISTGNDNSNLKCACAVRQISFVKIIVIVNEISNIKKFEEMGIEQIICPKKITIDTVDNMVRPEPHEITQVLITEHSLSIGLVVGEILLPSDCKITSIDRGEKTIAPRKETKIEK
ncbi:MAG: NAD-binding protein, partial [Thermoplasmata archaeon]